MQLALVPHAALPVQQPCLPLLQPWLLSPEGRAHQRVLLQKSQEEGSVGLRLDWLIVQWRPAIDSKTSGWRFNTPQHVGIPQPGGARLQLEARLCATTGITCSTSGNENITSSGLLAAAVSGALLFRAAASVTGDEQRLGLAAGASCSLLGLASACTMQIVHVSFLLASRRLLSMQAQQQHGCTAGCDSCPHHLAALHTALGGCCLEI